MDPPRSPLRRKALSSTRLGLPLTTSDKTDILAGNLFRADAGGLIHCLKKQVSLSWPTCYVPLTTVEEPRSAGKRPSSATMDGRAPRCCRPLPNGSDWPKNESKSKTTLRGSRGSGYGMGSGDREWRACNYCRAVNPHIDFTPPPLVAALFRRPLRSRAISRTPSPIANKLGSPPLSRRRHPRSDALAGKSMR